MPLANPPLTVRLSSATVLDLTTEIHMRRSAPFFLIAAMAASTGCGSSSGTTDAGTPVSDAGPSTDGGPNDGTTILIQSFAYSPASLTVPAGTSITVINKDNDVPHSLTSESAMNKYTAGAVSGVSFDTGVITGSTAGTSATIVIPSTAPSGTVVPFFCRVHTNMMPQGTITVQ